jgi:hypothetical protein
VRYQVAPLPAGWQAVRSDAELRAFHHVEGGTIAAHGSCGDGDDVSLQVLTNHLLFGIEDRHEQSRVPLVVDGRAALRTRLDGTLDGVRVAMDLVVIKKNGCTYDLLLIAPPAQWARRQPAFERFIAGFRSAGP